MSIMNPSPKAIRRATILEVVKVLAVEESTRYDLVLERTGD